MPLNSLCILREYIILYVRKTSGGNIYWVNRSIRRSADIAQSLQGHKHVLYFYLIHLSVFFRIVVLRLRTRCEPPMTAVTVRAVVLTPKGGEPRRPLSAMEEWSKRCAQYRPGLGACTAMVRQYLSTLGQLVRVTENGQRGRKHQQLESACRI